MQPEQAARYRELAQSTGESFSAIVCRMALGGERAHELAEEGAALTRDALQANLDLTQELAEMESSGQEEDERPAQKFPPRESLVGTLLDQVYACVGAEPTSLASIADHLGVNDLVVGEAVEELMDDGRSVILRRFDGEWRVWSEIDVIEEVV